MRNITAKSLVLIGILVIACGSSGSNPTEEGLRERAAAYVTAFSNEKWIEPHRFGSPEFQEKCPSGPFALFFGIRMAMLKDLMGIDWDEKFEFRVTGVRVDGLNGFVGSEVLYEGDPLDFGDSDYALWEFIDGQWWQVDLKYVSELYRSGVRAFNGGGVPLGSDCAHFLP